MPKRLIVCADGTWNQVEKAKSGKHLSTNAAKMAAAMLPVDSHGVKQLLCYLEGVGTHHGEWLRGGMFGLGISRNIGKAYEFLARSYEPDDEIWLFGFSRGAFTARSLAGMIRDCGLLLPTNIDQIASAMSLYRDRYDDTAPEAPRARIFRNTYSYEPSIKFIGVWDTVGSLGVPGVHLWLARLLDIEWQFHDTKLSRTVENAYHALAIHERRSDFEPTLWEKQDGANASQQTLEQVWFAGVHSDVGGGYAAAGLSDVAFSWMVEKAVSHGLAFRQDFLSDSRWFAPNPQQDLHNSFDFPFSWLDTFRRRKGDRTFRAKGANTFESIHSSVVERFNTREDPWPSTFLGELQRLKAMPVPMPSGMGTTATGATGGGIPAPRIP
jgi:uncharacterized protein (DUF2235 family)